MQPAYKKFLGLSLMFCFVSCASGPEKSSPLDPVKERSSPRSDEIDVSSNYNNFVNSISNDPLSARQVSKAALAALIKNLEGAVRGGAKEDDPYQALVGAKRVAGLSYASVADSASRFADKQMSKNIDRPLPDITKIELAIAAYSSREITMAEHWMIGLFESKNPAIKAAAHTLRGIIEYGEGRVPEAVNSWLLARKERPKFEAATLNLVVVSLKFGAYKFADVMLRDLSDDWLTSLAKATVARMKGDNNGAAQACKESLNSSKNRLNLLNCAIVEYQNNKEFSKAMAMLSQASSMQGGDSGFARAISETTKSVRRDGSEAQKEKALETRKEQAAKAEGAKREAKASKNAEDAKDTKSSK